MNSDCIFEIVSFIQDDDIDTIRSMMTVMNIKIRDIDKIFEMLQEYNQYKVNDDYARETLLSKYITFLYLCYPLMQQNILESLACVTSDKYENEILEWKEDKDGYLQPVQDPVTGYLSYILNHTETPYYKIFEKFINTFCPYGGYHSEWIFNFDTLLSLGNCENDMFGYPYHCISLQDYEVFNLDY